MKLFYELETENRTYKCRLTSRACVELEEKLGKNPLKIFTDIAQTGELPKTREIIEILRAALAPFRDVTLDDVYAIYDEYIDDGHCLEDFIGVIAEIFKVSGFFRKAPQTTEETTQEN